MMKGYVTGFADSNLSIIAINKIMEFWLIQSDNLVNEIYILYVDSGPLRNKTQFPTTAEIRGYHQIPRK